MEDRKDIEAWADALLEQHRTAPRRPAPEASVDDLPPALRLMVRLSGQEPDPEVIGRLRRSADRAARFSAIQAAVSLTGTILLLVFAVTFLNSF